MPRSLGETLASPAQPQPDAPRSAPEQTETSAAQTPPADRAPTQKASHQSAMSVYDERPKGGATFAYQDSLPKLPIPELPDTCRKYLSALKPLQSPREHAETKHAVHEFLRHDGVELQEKLKRYAEERTSYIEQFWYDSYLNFDNPVVLNLNPFFLLEDDPTPARNNQITRAASLVVSALEFVRAVRKEELPPDMVKGQPLDMYQYSRLFGTARVPTESGCQIEQDPESKHIIVMCHGQFYWFDVLDDNSDLIMSERDIAVNLQTVINDATQTPIQEAAKGALGVLSTENRKVWSGLRDVLTKKPGSNNADCLGIVDSALFFLCLDYTEPTNVADLCQNMLCGTSEIEKGVQIGTCTNRWYDKLQIIVCKNGSAGINFEHTGVDGHTVLRFASDVYTDTILRFARTINGQAPTLWASTSPDPSRRDPESFGDVNTDPRKLEWDITPELTIAVRFAETRLADLIGQNEFECLDFSGYGKNFMTSMGFSPDAFVQMAFQAAYYGLYGRIECTYEPAMTKTYLHGRTEAIRTVSDESVAFVQAFWADNSAEHKVDALRRACQRHVENTRDCLKGEGCDRHLYALFCLWQRLVDEEGASSVGSNGYSSPVDGVASPPAPPSPSSVGRSSPVPAPETPITRERGESVASRTSRGGGGGGGSNHYLPMLFADPGWDKLNTTIISSSNCGNPSLRQFGFGPVSGDGFGIGYIIKDERVSICVSSKHRQTRRFVDTLESYLLEIRRVLRITSRRGAGGSNAAAPKQTRAREVDGGLRPRAAAAANRARVRGRLIPGPDTIKSQKQQQQQQQQQQQNQPPSSHIGGMSPTDGGSTVTSDDDELGGYGFFDAGMLLQALKARGESLDAVETKASERVAAQARRREIGKKLRLIDY